MEKGHKPKNMVTSSIVKYKEDFPFKSLERSTDIMIFVQ